MTTRAERLIEEHKTLCSERTHLNGLWEEIAEVLSPERVGFITAQSMPRRRQQKIYDTQPIVSKRSLVNAIGAMLRPKSSAPGKWFDIVPEDPDLLDQRDVKEWIDFAEERLWKALYNPRAGFIQATGEVDDDLVTFGTGCGFVGVRGDQSGFRFKSFHLKDVVIAVDGDNNPVGVMISDRLSPIQAAARWGIDKLSPKARKALISEDAQVRNEKHLYVWSVRMREFYDPRIRNNRNMPFESIVIDVEAKHEIVEEGFQEFPFFIPRWDTRSGEVYGRGPGVLALPDVLSLNQMGKTMLRALHRAVDPPWLLPSDSMVNAPQMRPGGVSYYDAQAIRNLGLSDPFRQMDSRANIPWGLDAQARTREGIMAVFFRNILNLPVDAPQMTATEVIQRREEFVREIGAVFGRLESDYTGPIVERCFNIMLRRGAFGGPQDIPEALQGTEITFRFASPVEKAKRQIEESTITQAIGKVLEIGQIQPEVMMPYNWQEIGKYIGEANDLPSDLFLDTQELEARKAAQAQAQQAEMEMQMGERMAAAAGNVPPEMMAGQPQ